MATKRQYPCVRDKKTYAVRKLSKKEGRILKAQGFVNKEFDEIVNKVDTAGHDFFTYYHLPNGNVLSEFFLEETFQLFDTKEELLRLTIDCYGSGRDTAAPQLPIDVISLPIDALKAAVDDNVSALSSCLGFPAEKLDFSSPSAAFLDKKVSKIRFDERDKLCLMLCIYAAQLIVREGGEWVFAENDKKHAYFKVRVEGKVMDPFDLYTHDLINEGKPPGVAFVVDWCLNHKKYRLPVAPSHIPKLQQHLNKPPQ